MTAQSVNLRHGEEIKRRERGKKKVAEKTVAHEIYSSITGIGTCSDLSDSIHSFSLNAGSAFSSFAKRFFSAL